MKDDCKKCFNHYIEKLAGQKKKSAARQIVSWMYVFGKLYKYENPAAVSRIQQELLQNNGNLRGFSAKNIVKKFKLLGVSGCIWIVLSKYIPVNYKAEMFLECRRYKSFFNL